MNFIWVCLEVPLDIASGLASGQLVRDAAGIVRWAVGTKKAGEIVCHLKEAGSFLNAGGLMLPMGAMMLMQAAGFAYLGYQLKAIHSAIEGLRSEVCRIAKATDSILRMQWRERLMPVARGMEYLCDARLRPGLYVNAHNALREARGEISLFFSMTAPAELVEHLPQTREIISGLSSSMAGEYLCLQAQRADKQETLAVLDRYAEIYQTAKESLASCPKMTTMLPTARQFQHYRDARTLESGLQEIIGAIQGEQEFAEALASPDAKVIAQADRESLERADRLVLIMQNSLPETCIAGRNPL